MTDPVRVLLTSTWTAAAVPRWSSPRQSPAGRSPSPRRSRHRIRRPQAPLRPLPPPPAAAGEQSRRSASLSPPPPLEPCRSPHGQEHELHAAVAWSTSTSPIARTGADAPDPSPSTPPMPLWTAGPCLRDSSCPAPISASIRGG